MLLFAWSILSCLIEEDQFRWNFHQLCRICHHILYCNAEFTCFNVKITFCTHKYNIGLYGWFLCTKSNIYIEFYAILILLHSHYWKVIWVTQTGCSTEELWCIAPGIRNARFKIINVWIIFMKLQFKWKSETIKALIMFGAWTNRTMI